MKIADHLDKDHFSEVTGLKPDCNKWRREWEGRNEIQ